ncbi:interleukin-17D [Synchiropus picturatus]
MEQRRILLLLLQLMPLLLGRGAGLGRVRKKAARSRSCQDLSEDVLEQMFGRLSAGVLSAFHHALELEPLERVNRSCPSGARSPARSKSRPPANMLSVSPWAYRLSYDPARYPHYIPEAYCLCKGCLLGPYGEESFQHRSTPVYSPTVILRRSGTCVGGRHIYKEVYVSVAVGCTCVPLLEKERDGQSSNQSVERTGSKTGEQDKPDRYLSTSVKDPVAAKRRQVRP